MGARARTGGNVIFALSRQFYGASLRLSITELHSPIQEYFKYKEPLKASTFSGKGHRLLVSNTCLRGTTGNV